MSALLAIIRALLAQILGSPSAPPQPAPRPGPDPAPQPKAAPAPSRLKRGAVPAAVLALAIPLLVQLEGLRTTSYQDIVGTWTNCVGDTQGAAPGQHFTKQQCMDKLAARLPDYYAPIVTAIPGVSGFPAATQAALISLWYNEGAGTMKGSSVVRAANAGDLRAMCDAFLNFTRAGSNKAALLSRRQKERALCLQGLTTP